jgi:hypothetical protein
MVDYFGNIVNTPAPFFLVTLGTIFLVIAVIGNSKLWVIELNPGLCGRFLGLVLGLVFYAIAFSGSVLPPEFLQTIGDTLKTQLQENIGYFVSSILP